MDISDKGWVIFTLSALACGENPIHEYNTVDIVSLMDTMWNTTELGLAKDLRDGESSATTFSIDIPGVGSVIFWSEREYNGLEVGKFSCRYQNQRNGISNFVVEGTTDEIKQWLYPRN